MKKTSNCINYFYLINRSWNDFQEQGPDQAELFRIWCGVWTPGWCKKKSLEGSEQGVKWSDQYFKQWLLLWVDKTGEQNEYRKTNWEISQDNIKVEEYYDLKNQLQKVENSAWHQAAEKNFG